MHTKPESPAASCRGGRCRDAALDRRTFLQSAGCFGVSLAVLGLPGLDTSALAVTTTSGTSNGSERRYPLPTADGVTVDHDAQLLIARASGKVYVFALSCPHQNNVVKWLPKDHRFQCTKHDSQYTPDGVYTSGKATRNLDRYLIRRDGNSVVVDLHKWVQSDKDPSGWAAASVAV